MLKIALDAMGGDLGPVSVVEGACSFLKSDSSTFFQIFGDEPLIKPHIPYNLSHKIEIIHTVDVISGDTKPSAALRRGRKSSMGLAISSVAAKENAGVISGGNTGAFMGLSSFLMGSLPGVFRPAIASFFPTKVGGYSTMLDLGANAENDEFHLAQFALMGETLAQTALSIQNPRVALLNIGSEEVKGNMIIQNAHKICKNNPIFENFIGFVEGDQILSGDVDVTVTDGFSGNIALKALEGAAHAVAYELEQAFNESFLTRIAAFLAYPVLKSFKLKTDPSNYNGAVFLGIKGIAVKSHGSSTAKGFSSAILITKKIINLGLIEKLEEKLKKLPPELLKG